MNYEFSAQDFYRIEQIKGYEMRLTDEMALSLKTLMASRDAALASNEITTKQKMEIIMRVEREMMLRMNFLTQHPFDVKTT